MGVGHGSGCGRAAEVRSLGCRAGNFSGIDLYLARVFGGEVGRKGGLDGDLGHIAFEGDGHVGSLSRGSYGLGRGAAHQEPAGTFGGGGHLGEGAVIEGRGGFLERQQGRLIGDVAYRRVGDGIELDALAGCASGKGESGLLGRDLRGSEITSYKQAPVGIETEQGDRRERFFPAFGRGRGVEEGAAPGRDGFGDERDGDLVAAGGGNRNGDLFLFGARGEGDGSGKCQNDVFHD